MGKTLGNSTPPGLKHGEDSGQQHSTWLKNMGKTPGNSTPPSLKTWGRLRAIVLHWLKNITDDLFL